MAGSPSDKGLSVESPCGGKRPGKEELLQWFPRDWLVIDEPFLVGDLVLWLWGAVSFPLTQWSHLNSGSCRAHERRECGLKGELVASAVGVL